MEISYLWTKKGDGKKAMRELSVKFEIPVKTDLVIVHSPKPNEIILRAQWYRQSVMDAYIANADAFGYSNSVSIKDDKEYDAAPTMEQFAEAVVNEAHRLRTEKAEREEESRKNKEDRHAKKVARAMEILAMHADKGNADISLMGESDMTFLIRVAHHEAKDFFSDYWDDDHPGNAELRAVQKVVNDARDRVKRILSDREDAEREAEEAKQEKRREYIKAWALENGSDLLKKQVALGLEGWPRYLRERIQHDLQGVGCEGKPITDKYELVHNPEDALVDVCLAIKGLADSGSVECSDVIPARDGDQYDGYEYFAVVDDYVPGPSELFGKYTVRCYPVD